MRLGGEGLVRVGLGWLGRALLNIERPSPPPDPTRQQNKEMRGLLRKFLSFEGGLWKFLCVGLVPSEVRPLDLETITFATWG